MNRDAVLLDRLFSLTRGDLESAELPFPALSTRFGFTTVTRIASFWRAQDGGPRTSFEQSVVDFVSGLFGGQLTWAYLIEAEKDRIAVRVGAEGTAGIETVRTSLRGALPDIGLTSGVIFRDSALSSFPYAVAVVGCPTAKTDTERGVMSDQIERLCRGLFGARWAYLIESTPVDAPETTLHVNEVLHEIRAAHETLLLKGSAVDEHNRLARQYIELLEAKLRRLQQGRACGRWRVGAYLLAENEDVIGRGAALLAAAFAGDASALPA